MSPSEAEAVSLGVVLEQRDRTDETNEAGRRLWFYRFAKHVGRQRYQMRIKWSSKPGAWQAALRWVKRLKDGRLS